MKDEAIKLLKDIRHISHVIEIAGDEMSRLYAALTSTTIRPKDIDVQTTSPLDPLGDKMAQIIEYQERLKDYYTELYIKKVKALNVLKQMSTEEQEVLLLRYFKGYSVEDVGIKVGYTYRWAWEKIHQAEENFIVLYEKST